MVARYAGKVQAQEVLSQSSFYSANGLRLHFGLGAAEEASLEIRWPDGSLQRIEKAGVNRYLDLKKP